VEGSTRLEHDVGASRSLYWALEQPNRCWKLPAAPDDFCLTGQATSLQQKGPEATVLLPDSALRDILWYDGTVICHHTSVWQARNSDICVGSLYPSGYQMAGNDQRRRQRVASVFIRVRNQVQVTPRTAHCTVHTTTVDPTGMHTSTTAMEEC